MKIYLIKKEKGKKYESRAICEKVLGFRLEYNGEKPLGCSISDTKNYWVCSVGECGLDIEEKGRKVKPNIIKALHGNEQEYLEGLNYGSSEWDYEFFSIWTAKEAVYKLTGRNFKQQPVISGDLSYIDEIDGFYIQHFEYKGIIGSLISKDTDFEIEERKYAGKMAKECMEYAAGLLAVKAYSSADMLKKLKTKGYSEDESGETVRKLTELGYIDDAEYARRFAENASESGKGYLYIRNKLRLSGIPDELIPDDDSEKEFDAALALAESWYRETDDYSEKQKYLSATGRKLAGRGFAPKTVYKVLERLRS